jgi:general secretion pathway protein C
MASRVLTLLIWLLVGASLVAYGLRAWPGSAPSAAPLVPLASADIGVSPEAWRRFMGAAAAAPSEAGPPPDARYTLLGVAAPRADDQQRLQGVALLSVDGAPPRAVRVGQWVDAQTQLIAVSARGADLGRDGVVRAHLPLQGPPDAATGTLPAVPSGLTSGYTPGLSPTPAATRQPMPVVPTTPIAGVAMPAMPAPLPDPAQAVPPGRDSDEAGPRRVRSETAR